VGDKFVDGGKRVAFQGEPGAYSEMATIQYFRNSNLVPTKSLQDVFDALRQGDVDFGVVPIENSIEGSVNETYDLLLDTDFVVSGEIYLRVRHCLIVNKGGSWNITSVYSHPQALAQCRRYLQRMKLATVAAYDTAGAVKMIKQKKTRKVAAIASRRAAELYDMDILEEGIEDNKNNFTRFLIMSKIRTKSTGRDGTSMIFSVKHIPGALYSILEEFANRNINLTKIESRPKKEKPWEYNFYLDFEGHIDNKIIDEAVESIKKKAAFIKILGSYERAEFLPH
jgi:prephenate dehydratase